MRTVYISLISLYIPSIKEYYHPPFYMTTYSPHSSHWRVMFESVNWLVSTLCGTRRVWQWEELWLISMIVFTGIHHFFKCYAPCFTHFVASRFRAPVCVCMQITKRRPTNLKNAQPTLNITKRLAHSWIKARAQDKKKTST